MITHHHYSARIILPLSVRAVALIVLLIQVTFVDADSKQLEHPHHHC